MRDNYEIIGSFKHFVRCMMQVEKQKHVFTIQGYIVLCTLALLKEHYLL